ncbi:MAG: transposase [Caldisphaeraceae archaeon]|nr:transposase [Caldisphaeraceae archaeon]MEB3798600.1 transposase [Caldisphaeraceae archaeon]
MERFKGIEESISYSSRLNRRLQAWSFGKLQLEYKANLEGIQVVYINPKNTSRRCHRCGF